MSKLKKHIRSSIILTFGRREGQKCKACKRTICTCSNGCKCNEAKIAAAYGAEGILENASPDSSPTIDIILSNIYDIKKRGPLLWTELEWLPVHIPHENGVYSDETVEAIEDYLKAFAIKLRCEDCIEHYKSRKPFEGDTPIDLWKYINDLHNKVNESDGKYIFPFDKFMEKIARVAKQHQLISGGDIFKSDNQVNLPDNI